MFILFLFGNEQSFAVSADHHIVSKHEMRVVTKKERTDPGRSVLRTKGYL